MTAIFVDTNVLVYADQAASQFHHYAKGTLARLEGTGAELWISRQVIREYLAVVTKPTPSAPHLPIMLLPDAIRSVERFLEAFWVAEDGSEVTTHLLSLLNRFPTAGRQIHDANIVATMMAYGISSLVTFNIADFRRFSSVLRLEPVNH